MEDFKPPSIASFRLKGHTLAEAKRAREHAINQNARLRLAKHKREERKAYGEGHDMSQHGEGQPYGGEYAPGSPPKNDSFYGE